MSGLQPVSILGAPTDIGGGVVGARMGPLALRVAGLPEAVSRFGVQVHDCGDLDGPLAGNRAAVNGYRHLEEIAQWNRSVYQGVTAALERNHLPLLLGGDHSLALGSISAVADHCRAVGKKLLVLWLDAHADFNTREITPSGNLHGMPVACLCGFGPPSLLSIARRTPALLPSQLRLIGVRSVDEGEKSFLRQQQLPVYDMRYIDEIGMRRTLELAMADCESNTHLHVSLDVDFIDPEIAPGVGTPVRGGPTYREAQLCMEMIADTGCLGSLDLVEINPAMDVRNQTADLAVDLVESLFGKSTLERFQHT